VAAFFGADIAKFLGISETDYRTALQAGQTPLRSPRPTGNPPLILKTHLQDQLKTRLGSGRDRWQDDQSTRDCRLNQASTMIDKFINNTLPQRGQKGAGPGNTYGRSGDSNGDVGVGVGRLRSMRRSDV